VGFGGRGSFHQESGSEEGAAEDEELLDKVGADVRFEELFEFCSSQNQPLSWFFG